MRFSSTHALHTARWNVSVEIGHSLFCIDIQRRLVRFTYKTRRCIVDSVMSRLCCSVVFSHCLTFTNFYSLYYTRDTDNFNDVKTICWKVFMVNVSRRGHKNVDILIVLTFENEYLNC